MKSFTSHSHIITLSVVAFCLLCATPTTPAATVIAFSSQRQPHHPRRHYDCLHLNNKIPSSTARHSTNLYHCLATKASQTKSLKVLYQTGNGNNEIDDTSVSTSMQDSATFKIHNNGSSMTSKVEQFVGKFLSAGGGGEVGNRGEPYFFVQATLILCIVLGTFPALDYLRLLIGPGLFVAGVIVLGVTALNMGESITPWPKPNGQGLVQNGLYGQVRHPMYTGLLSVMIGFSFATGSIDRLLLTGLLYLTIDIKSNYEEQELAKMYSEYDDYQKKVPNKFVPEGLLDLMTTTNKQGK